MRYFLILATLLCFSFTSIAQLTDDFADGDFTGGLAEWLGNTDRFQVNTEELQLNDANYVSPTSSLYLNAPTQGATTWEFYVRMDFNPSSTNFTKVYLNADASDFEGSLNGYYVLLGDTDDVVELVKQTGTSSSTLISSAVDAIDVSEPIVRVRVTRDASNTWELFTDLTGGTNFTSLGTSIDADHQLGFFFGVRCRYTTTRKDKFFFDDFFVDPLYVDTTPPEIVSVTTNSLTEIAIQFDEPLDAASASDVLNFTLDNGAIIATTMLDPSDPTIVIMTLGVPLINLADYNLSSTVSDSAGNASNTSASFTLTVPENAEPFDLLVNEIMADPSPVVGLPDAEFVEIYNRSTKVLDLADYEISSGSTPQLMPTYILLPGEYVVVCDDSNVADFLNLGISNAIAVSSFNALTNGGDNVTITNLSGQIIHSVDYEDDWYQDDVKEDGGWTLELKNPENPCDITIGNWSASNNPLGGTPGQQNSIFDTSSSGNLVELLGAETLDPFQVQLTFNTALESASAINIANYIVDNGIGNPDNIFLLNPNTIIMEFNTGLLGNTDYSVTVSNLNDCTGDNGIDPSAATATFKLPEPMVLSAVVQYPSQAVVVTYDVAMDAASVGDVSNYDLDGTNPSNITILGPFTVELTFSDAFINGTSYDLEISNASNTDGTIIEPNPTTIPFIYYEPVDLERYDIIINEFLPDPSDAVSLPELEFIELYNRSDKVISLEGFTLNSGTTSSSALPLFIIQPNDYVIVSKIDNEWNYDNYNNNIALASMISLTNGGDDVSLLAPNGDVIDALLYDLSWYDDTSKDDGGYSLERVNPMAPCEGGENWRASIASIGGTPGAQNSVLDEGADATVPTIVFAFPDIATNLEVVFSKAIDVELATDPTSFTIDGGINVILSSAVEPLVNAVNILIDPATPLQPNTIYELTVSTQLTDCLGIPFESNSTILFALPDDIEAGDVIINEVLFDPLTGGSDFIELYNNSDKVLNVADLVIVNDVASSSPNKPIEENYLLFPESYVVITSNPTNIAENYNVPDESLLRTNDLPTLSADFGNVTLVAEAGLIDRFDYEEEYHIELLDETKGVSLERIDFNAVTNDRNNWHSAASDVGFATPAYQNSQIKSSTPITNESEVFFLEEETFSPDNDGYKDFLLINYNLPTNGSLVNIKIFDAKGRMIKDLVQNELLATEGFYQWDGTNEEGTKARIGIYIVWIEMFSESGNVSIEKETCVLAGQF